MTRNIYLLCQGQYLVRLDGVGCSAHSKKSYMDYRAIVASFIFGEDDK